MKFIKTKKGIALLAVVAVAAVAAFGAYAYFRRGSEAATGTVGASTGFTIAETDLGGPVVSGWWPRRRTVRSSTQ